MKWLAAISYLLLLVFLSGCETIGIEEAGPDIWLIKTIDKTIDFNEWVEISYSDGTGKSVKINYFNDEYGYAQALAQKVCWHLENSFGDYLLERETVELRVKVVSNFAYVDVFSLGKQFGSIVYKIQDFSCLDFLAKEIICPELVGEKKPST